MNNDGERFQSPVEAICSKYTVLSGDHGIGAGINSSHTEFVSPSSNAWYTPSSQSGLAKLASAVMTTNRISITLSWPVNFT